MNYDVNIQWARQTVRLTFGMWEARATMEVDVGGNCKGADIFDSALYQAYDRLLQAAGQGVPTLVMKLPDGDELHCDDEDDDGEDWLKAMCIGFEIISIRPEKPAVRPEKRAA